MQFIESKTNIIEVVLFLKTQRVNKQLIFHGATRVSVNRCTKICTTRHIGKTDDKDKSSVDWVFQV